MQNANRAIESGSKTSGCTASPLTAINKRILEPQHAQGRGCAPCATGCSWRTAPTSAAPPFPASRRACMASAAAHAGSRPRHQTPHPRRPHHHPRDRAARRPPPAAPVLSRPWAPHAQCVRQMCSTPGLGRLRASAQKPRVHAGPPARPRQAIKSICLQQAQRRRHNLLKANSPKFLCR